MKENQCVSEAVWALAKDVRCLFIYRASIRWQAWSRACVHIFSTCSFGIARIDAQTHKIKDTYTERCNNIYENMTLIREKQVSFCDKKIRWVILSFCFFILRDIFLLITFVHQVNYIQINYACYEC